MTNDTIPKAEPVYNEIAEGLREMRWVFGELKRIACDEPDLYEKYRLADLVGGDLDVLDRRIRGMLPALTARP